MNVRMKEPDGNTEASVTAGGNSYTVSDHHVSVPESAVAELEGKGWTRDPAPNPQPGRRPEPR